MPSALLGNNLWLGNSLGHQNPIVAGLRILVLIQVALSGLAYGQVEIPQLFYTAIGYLTAFLFALIFMQLRKSANLWLLIIPVSYFLVNLFWSIGQHEVNLGLLYTILIAEYLLLDRNSKIWVYQKYRIFIVWMCAIGSICFLSFINHWGLPFVVQDYYFGNMHYINYHFAYLATNANMVGGRLCGLFNEPGFLGTVCALVLVIEKMNFRKFGNIVILIASIFTFSMAFWMIIIIYMILSNVNKPKRFLTIIAVVAAAILFVGNISNVNVTNRQMMKLLHRFEFVNGEFKGDNRTDDLFDKVYDRFMASDEIWLGEGPDAMQKYNLDNTSSYKMEVLKYGFVGFAILWCVPLFCALKCAGRNRDSLILLLCFFASSYQRPHFYIPCYMCLLFGGIDYLKALPNYMTAPVRRFSIGDFIRGFVKQQRFIN